MTKADKEGQRKAPILRFKGFTDDWEQRKLSEMTQQVKRTSDSENPILTISAKNGWMDQKDRFNRVIAGKELKSYIELYKNELSYNHGNSKYAKFGIIYVQRKYEKALVPKVYHSFSMSYGDPRFIENLSLGHKLDKELSKFITSGARQDGLLNINKKSFYAIKLFIPSEQEQIKISNIMDVINHIITLYERKLKLLSRMKKYFLDNLFAEKEYPNLRFKGFTDAWEQRKLENLGNIRTGNTPSKSHTKYYSSNNGKESIPWVTPTDINSEYTTQTNLYLTSEGQKYARIVPPDTLLMTCIASIGKNTISTDVSGFNQQINAIIPNDKSNIRFLYFISFKISKYMNKIAPAGMMPIINKTEFSKIKVYIPVINEQNKISNLMEKLNYLLTLHENKQQHLTEIKKTLLNTMFI